MRSAFMAPDSHVVTALQCNFGLMHEHKIGIDGSACSICENRRQESDITVSEILLLSHYILGSVRFYTVAILVI